MFSAKFNLIKPFSRLIKKQKLETLDIIYKGQPFCNVVSKNQNTYNLDTTYLGQPFVGTPNNYVKRVILGINHPDVENWLNTVSLNNGSASSTTIAALNTFCNSIDSAGLRNKFYRLNLFCGNNLSSCLVPLYNSASPNGLPLGFSIDINNNFTSSDYNETGANGGLKGDRTLSKRLNTGFFASLLDPYDFHAASYEIVGSDTTYDNSLGAWISTYNQGFYIGMDATTSMWSLSLINNGIQITPSTYSGHYIGVQTGNKIGAIYKNGSVVSSLYVGGGNTSSSWSNVTWDISIFAGQKNSAGTYGEYSSARLGGYSFGLALDNTQSLLYYNAIQTFQASLNRNV